MQSPFEHTDLPAFLTNFSFENEHDQVLYQYIADGRKFDERLIQGIRELLASAESERRLRGYPGSLQEERDHYLKNWLNAEIKAIEMERLAMALDVKLCQLAAHVLEPFPGLFEQVGISQVYEAHRRWQENQETLRAEIKAKLRVIKGGQE